MSETPPNDAAPYTPVKGVKYMNIQEFCQLGYLQEVNRLFFHPRGLALEIYCTDENYADAQISGVWDYRDDPEGMIFGPGMIDPKKIERVLQERQRHVAARSKLFGLAGHGLFGPTGVTVQPAEWTEDGPARNEQA